MDSIWEMEKTIISIIILLKKNIYCTPVQGLIFYSLQAKCRRSKEESGFLAGPFLKHEISHISV